MTQLLEISEQIISTDELRCRLEPLLTDYFGVPRKISKLDRRPYEYRSSFPIEELCVNASDGSSLRLIFKNLGGEALPDFARRTKPQFIHDPRREIEAYRKILAKCDLGTATFYGALADDKTQRFWLFIEKVPGLELYQIGDISVWQEAARWLARMHTRFVDKVSELDGNANLMNRDEDFYWTWMRRAEQFADSGSSADKQARIKDLAATFQKVVENIMKLPRTFIHGEFYASNVLVQQISEGLRVCPVDWEMAGVGSGIMDLAALTSGKWTEDEKTTIAMAYHSAIPNGIWSTTAEFLTALDYCRLALAVQWLGWSLDWAPPAEHKQDWLKEAMRLTKKLSLLSDTAGS